MNTLPLDFSGISQLSTIEEVQAKLEAVRPIYDVAKKRVAGEDEEWNAKADYLRKKMISLVNSFKETDPPHAASYRMGQMQSITEELNAPRMIVLQFEEMQKRFHAKLDAKSAANKKRLAN